MDANLDLETNGSHIGSSQTDPRAIGPPLSNWTFRPFRFLVICLKGITPVSMYMNLLWPTVVPAIALNYASPDRHLAIFILNYIAMVPSANLIGFAGIHLSRQTRVGLGAILKTFLSSAVEIIMFVILIKNDTNGALVIVIQAAILGSMLCNLLLCTGMIFFVSGIRNKQETFHPAITEVGSGLLLLSGFGLLIPSAFFAALEDKTNKSPEFTMEMLHEHVTGISRGTSIILIIGFIAFMWFNLKTDRDIYEEVFIAEQDLVVKSASEPLSLAETAVSVVIAVTCVTMTATFLVQQINEVVLQTGVPETFMGLALIPLVEKAAEHTIAVDEAWRDQTNLALFHCLMPSIETSLLNGPLVVLVGWGLGKDMNLNFEIFVVVLHILTVLAISFFLRDKKSNYLKGLLCVLVYIIAVLTTWYYPNSTVVTTNASITNSSATP